MTEEPERKARGKSRPIEERAVGLILGMSLGKLSTFAALLCAEDPETAHHLTIKIAAIFDGAPKGPKDATAPRASRA